jgi:hypothetical protein
MYDDDPLAALFGVASAIAGTGGLAVTGSDAAVYVVAGFAAIVGGLLLLRFAHSLRRRVGSR